MTCTGNNKLGVWPCEINLTNTNTIATCTGDNKLGAWPCEINLTNTNTIATCTGNNKLGVWLCEINLTNTNTIATCTGNNKLVLLEIQQPQKFLHDFLLIPCYIGHSIDLHFHIQCFG